MSRARTGDEAGHGAAGALLREWRVARRYSQLGLAIEANVSARHLSFVETGRAGVSADMVLRLAAALDVPLRERNLLLQAAGHAPVYRESSLTSTGMRDARQALVLMLRGQEPFGAWAMDARWRLLMLNRWAAAGFGAWLGRPLPAFDVLSEPRPNLLEMLVSPAAREALVNRDAVVTATLARAHRDAIWNRDRLLEAEVRQLAGRAGVSLTQSARTSAPSLVIPIEVLGPDGVALRYFNTIATLGAPQDVTLQELRIESLHAADEATARAVERLFAGLVRA